jgi:hypothetical protein
MSDRPQHLDFLFREWPYEFGEVSARMVVGSDGREVLQMRLEMGVLQMETTGRPDGTRPGGCETYFHWLEAQAGQEGDAFALDADRCTEIDREFVQFFQRRVAWLALGRFDRAVADADHTLALMDFSSQHAPDEDWAELHEQYRPFVLFHRTQAAALVKLQQASAANAVAEIDAGMELIRAVLSRESPADEVEEEIDDELLTRLAEMKAAIVEQYDVQPSLAQQLADAIAAEQYELAAQLRDQMGVDKKGRR